MICHECAMAGRQQPAVALCKYCMVALCKHHLVLAYQRSDVPIQYACSHRPWDTGQSIGALPEVALDTVLAPSAPAGVASRG